MRVQVQPLGSGSSISWIDNITSADSYGLVRAQFDATNAPDQGWVSSANAPKSRVQRANEFALRHDYEALRRLAD